MLKEEESCHEAFFPGGGFRLDFLLTAYGVLRRFFRMDVIIIASGCIEECRCL